MDGFFCRCILHSAFFLAILHGYEASHFSKHSAIEYEGAIGEMTAAEARRYLRELCITIMQHTIFRASHM
jgi:hypothetical protein